MRPLVSSSHTDLRVLMAPWRLLGWVAGLCGLVLVFGAWLSPDMLLALANGTFLCG